MTAHSNDDLVGDVIEEFITNELRIVKAPFQDVLQQKHHVIKNGVKVRERWVDVPVVRQDQLPREIS